MRVVVFVDGFRKFSTLRANKHVTDEARFGYDVELVDKCNL